MPTLELPAVSASKEFLDALLTLTRYVVFYAEPPRFDADGTQTLAKMTRYRQGVVVPFRPPQP